MDIWDGIGIETGGFFISIVRGVSNACEGSKILTFLYGTLRTLDSAYA